MLRSIFSGLGIYVSKKQLDASAMRQKVISDNIANVNTPGFKRSDVSFEDKLQEVIGQSGKSSLATTNKKHFSGKPTLASLNNSAPAVIQDQSTSTRTDENNVDIDREMVGLAKNQMKYETFTRVLGSKYRGLRSVINDGRR